MTNLDFLLEIGTAELPARHIETLATALATKLEAVLQAQQLTYGAVKVYGTPRRLAVIVEQLITKQPEQLVVLRGPAVSVAYDALGKLTVAGQKFAATAAGPLEQEEGPKGTYVVCKKVQQGVATAELLPGCVTTALHNLPLPRSMRWGSGTISFLRPVQWVVMIYGTQVITTELLGVTSGKVTYGHRFLCPKALPLSEANQYETVLQAGYVIADFKKRLLAIRQQLQATPGAVIDAALLQEVTGLVEWPVVLKGNFGAHFLALPEEVLVHVLTQQQKCFPVSGDQGLQAQFLLVSNIIGREPSRIIEGNEKVIHARLTDAEFFYHSDLKHPLESYVPKLAATIFQAKLGSLHDKTQRVMHLATMIATSLQIKVTHVARAALLAKCDLMTDMVNEFPELQGIMGYYYAGSQGEAPEVAWALREQYLPRFAQDQLPASEVGIVLALADRIDTLVGAFVLNKVPTGDKDPLGLRRAAIAILRIIIEHALPLDIEALFTEAIGQYQRLVPSNPLEQLLKFTSERLRVLCLDYETDMQVIQAVLGHQVPKLWDLKKRLMAVSYFKTLPAAAALTQAHKRVTNILHKAQLPELVPLDPKLFQDPAEVALAQHLTELKTHIASLEASCNYQAALVLLAELKPTVDLFFTQVMVMVDDQALRLNRLALLQELHKLFIYIADISKL